MARPIAETPILFGEDAVRFEEHMRMVESMTAEQRRQNSRRLKASVAEASKFITIRI